ncbi:MAG TPA: ABC transporter substrate-binding protein [Burkholderiales bacterium]|nr:ABC transporter substrate-binding protein [Burkholderiales bacterium]
MVDVQRRGLLLAAVIVGARPVIGIAQSTRVRRIGVLTGISKADPEGAARIAEFEQQLKRLGWVDGSNVRIDYRHAEADANQMAKLAKELLDLQPDVLVASGNQTTLTFRQQTLSVPIVFVLVSDPVGNGLVANLGRPEGNVTGFTNFQPSIASKWLQVLKECVPNVNRVAIVFDPGNPSWSPYVRAAEAAAPRFNVQLVSAGVRNEPEIKDRIASFAKAPNGAFIVLPSPFASIHREVLIAVAAKYALPAIYPYAYYATSGGLMSYGINSAHLHGEAASYVAQILKGTKPADLPVRQPTKFELVINLQTAEALGIKIPQSVLALADRVIQSASARRL